MSWGGMKMSRSFRWMVVVMLTVLLMGAAKASEVVPIQGAEAPIGAVRVESGKVYEIGEVRANFFGEGDIWYSVLSPADGMCTLFFDAFSQVGTSYDVYDERLQGIKDGYADAYQETKVTFSVEKGKLYYFTVSNNNYWGSKRFSVCFDGYHVPVDDIEQPAKTRPSCEKEGEAIRRCLLCGEIAEKVVVPAKGHEVGEWQTGDKATCTDEGTLVQRCITCKKVINKQSTPAIGHAPGEMKIGYDATCLAPGQKVQNCLTCGELLATEEIAMTGHTLGEMKIVSPATCTEDGRGEQRCSLCNTLMNSETVAAYGHESGAWIETRAASCVAAGEQVKKCVICGEIMEKQEIPMLQHSPS